MSSQNPLDNLNLTGFFDDRGGIPQGSSDYSSLQAEIARMEKLVNTLNEFHAQTHPLDLNHQNAVIALRDVVMSLFEAAPPFQGKAAESLFQLMVDYLHAELSFTGAQGDSSPQLAAATRASQKTADLIHQQLQTLYAKADEYAYTVDQARNVPELLRPEARLLDASFPSDATLAAACALPPVAIELVQDMEYDESDWGRQMNSLGEEPPPPLPPEPTDAKVFTLPPSSFQDALTNDELALANRLAKEYGVDVDDIIRLLEYNPTLSEQELRKIIANYLAKQKQYPSIPSGMLLLAVAMGLPDSMLEYMTHLNDGQSNVYLKGSPGNTIADLLASVLGELTQEAKTQLSMLQSAIRKSLNGQTFADQKAKEQAIIDAVESTGTIWDDLPEAVQNMLLGKIGRGKYKFAYGNSIESLVKQKLEVSYPNIRKYYIDDFGLQFNKGLPGRSALKPDIQITEDGQTIVMDITSQGNMSDKKKYLIDIIKILIALGY